MPARASWAWRSQCASLLACHTPLRLGLPSAVRDGRAAWPVAFVIESATMAPNAAETTAIARGPLRLLAITSLPHNVQLQSAIGNSLLQRIDTALVAEVGRGVLFGRVRTFASRKRGLFDPRAEHHRRQPVISLVTPRLVIDPIGLLVLFDHLLLHRPRFRPCGRVF